jgi:hypothetical protein
MAGEKHKELQDTAIRWLYNRGCCVFGQEIPTRYGGIADALGVVVRDERTVTPEGVRWLPKETVYYFEAKASRSDLICKKQKIMYEKIIKWDEHDADFYYLIVADGVKVEPNLYPLFGVISERGELVRKAKRIKRTHDANITIKNISHVLVYKVFGKLYLNY